MKRVPALAMMLVWWPLLFLACGVAFVVWVPSGWIGRLACLLGWWYLVPPVLCRLLLWRPLQAGSCAFSSANGLRWFACLQIQMPLQRLALSEELLRLVPGLYQLWLRLWGSRVALDSVWGPAVVVADRWALDVGPRAVIGARAHLGGHVLVPGSVGPVILLGRIRIGAEAVVGALCAVGPGAELAAGAVLPATRPLPPGSHLAADGTRLKVVDHHG